MPMTKESLTALRFVGEAGAGLVKVTINGLGYPIKVDIDESLLRMDKSEVLSDLISAAARIGMEKADEEIRNIMVKEFESQIKTYLEEAAQYGNPIDPIGYPDDGKYNN
jgi:nucleoid-associated protein EbfC